MVTEKKVKVALSLRVDGETYLEIRTTESKVEKSFGMRTDLERCRKIGMIKNKAKMVLGLRADAKRKCLAMETQLWSVNIEQVSAETEGFEMKRRIGIW